MPRKIDPWVTPPANDPVARAFAAADRAIAFVGLWLVIIPLIFLFFGAILWGIIQILTA